MSNPVKEYLLSIGLDLNKIKLQQTQKGIEKTEGLLQKTRQAADFLKRGLDGVALSMLAVAGASAKLVTSLAKQDQSFETFAQKLFVSKKGVYEFQYAVKALGVTIDEIQFNPTLMRQYKELVSDSRRLMVGKEYEGAMGTIRSFLFEFVRLKHEASYLLQWIGFSIIKNLQGPLEKARQTIRSINDYIVKNMPKIGEVIGKLIFNAKNLGKSIFDFFSGIVKEIQNFWTSLPDWAKNFITGAGIIGAIFIGMQNPLIFVSTLLAGIALLIDDFQKHLQGKKAKFGEFWDNLIKWINAAKKTIYEWKDNSIKWIENFVQICKTKIPEIKNLWDNVAKWISENGSKSVDSLMKLISTTDDFFSRMSFYWSRHKANPGEFWWKVSTGQMESEYQAYLLEKKKEERGENSGASPAGGVQSLGNIGGGKWDKLISEYAAKYNISPRLLKSVMMQESKGDPSVVSAAGAMGLMQLMPETAKGLGVNDPFDPRQNIEGGAKYLAQLSKKYNGNTLDILRAYNWGMGNVDALKAGQLAPSQIPAETVNYTNSILKMLNAPQKGGANSDGVKITPIVQARGNTCGVVSVAMANNAINQNNKLTEDLILGGYGFNLRGALNATTKKAKWRDLGNKYITDKEINAMAAASDQGLPFIFAANGPQFSPSGRGHFMTGQKVDRKKQLIIYVDPADGKTKTATFEDLKNAELHPDGNAVFIPSLIERPKAPKKGIPSVQKKQNGGKITALPKEEERKGRWRYNWQKIQNRLNEINPFANNAKDLQASAGFFNNTNSNVYLGGINLTINTTSNDPQAIGNVVTESLQNRINYFALNRGLNLS